MRTLALALLLAPVLAAAPRMHPYAPPAIPHPVDPAAACTGCHGPARAGGIPGVPHKVGGYCQSCHVPTGPARPFKSNRFKGDPAAHGRGARAYPGAPPAVPHAVFMRENCQACHGAEAHPGMRRNPHPGRANCLSCHLPG